MHRIDSHAAKRSVSAPRLKISFTIGLLTCFLAATSSHIEAADGAWRERYSAYQTSARRDKEAARPESVLSGPLFAVVSIADQRISVYGSEGLAARSPISTGMRGHPTPTGVFSIVQKKRFHRSNIYSGAPMPFMQRITWSGIAMHAGVLPGYPASHGCIRLPSSFAQRMFGATEIGQRVLIAPRDTTPVEIAHKTLPVPVLMPAPAGEAVSAAETGAVTASIDVPQPQTGAAPEKVSISDAPAETRGLNPLDFARALKRNAAEKAGRAARAAREATLLNAKKMTESRLALRRFAMAENALENAKDRLVVAARRLERAQVDIVATKAADAKTVEARLAAANAAEVKAAEAKATHARAVEAAEAAKPALEIETAKPAPETEVTEALAGNAQESGPAQQVMIIEASAAETQPGEAKPAEVSTAPDAANDEKRKAAELAQKSADEARKAAEKAEKVAVAARAAADEAQKSAEARALREQDDLAKASEARTAAEAAIVEARKALDEAREIRKAKQDEMDAVRHTAEAAKVAGRAASKSLAEASRRLKPLSVFISRKTGRLYVRQDFEPLFDAPITIGEPERPIGTHMFVSTGTGPDGATLKWSAVTMPFLEPEANTSARDRKGRRADGDETGAAPVPVAAHKPETAAGALDRIAIPEETARRLGELAWVGATVIVSDNGISGETGETTDFIILTRSRAAAP